MAYTQNIVKNSVFIKAPFEMVAGFLDDGNNWIKWNTSYSDFKFISGSGEVGSKFESKLAFAGEFYLLQSELKELIRTADSASETDIFKTDKGSTGYQIITSGRKDDWTEVIMELHFDEPFDKPLIIQMLDNTMKFGLNNLKLMLENAPKK